MASMAGLEETGPSVWARRKNPAIAAIAIVGILLHLTLRFGMRSQPVLWSGVQLQTLPLLLRCPFLHGLPGWGQFFSLPGERPSRQRLQALQSVFVRCKTIVWVMHRTVAMGRKNYLFLGSDNGGTAAGVLYSVLASAKANQVEPFAYVRDLLVELSYNSPPNAAFLLPEA